MRRLQHVRAVAFRALEIGAYSFNCHSFHFPHNIPISSVVALTRRLLIYETVDNGVVSVDLVVKFRYVPALHNINGLVDVHLTF